MRGGGRACALGPFPVTAPGGDHGDREGLALRPLLHAWQGGRSAPRLCSFILPRKSLLRCRLQRGGKEGGGSRQDGGAASHLGSSPLKAMRPAGVHIWHVAGADQIA